MTIQAQQSQEAAETSSPSPAEAPGESLQREFRERVAAGLEKAGHKRAVDDVLDSEVVEDDSVEDTPPPPKGGTAARASTAAAGGKTADGKAGKEAAPDGKKPSGEDDAERARPQPRYDSRSFNAWVSNNPEKAAELASKVFKVQLGDKADAWKQHFIAAENGRRRHAEQVEKDTKALDEQRAELDRLAKEAREPLESIIGVIEAEQKEDFPAIDRFIETTFKCSFNDYCSRRLRGLAKETTTERAQKQKLSVQEQRIAELEAKLAEQGEPAGKDGKGKAPQVSQKWLEREIPEDHGVRELGGWQDKVRAVYAESYDEEGDEYGLSIEAAAEKVLEDFLAKRTGRPPPKEGKQGKGAQPRQRREQRTPQRRESARERSQRVWTDDDEDDDARTPAGDLDDEAPPEDFQERTRWALNRAGRRR